MLELNGNSRMFKEVKTWNPVTGCLHFCRYCWARSLVQKRLSRLEKYKNGFKPTFHSRELDKHFKAGITVFVVSMGDLFGSWVPREWIERVLDTIRKNPQTTFLLLTKNPARYNEFDIPPNALIGATIETDLDELYIRERISLAPSPSKRIQAMKSLDGRKIISIEPVIKFSQGFAEKIISLDPRLVYYGHDNYRNNLPEPDVKSEITFLKELDRAGLHVILKTVPGVILRSMEGY